MMVRPGHKDRERDDLLLTEEMIGKMAEIVGKGNFRHIAAARLGVPPNTLFSWVFRGKKYLKKGNRDAIQARLVLALDEAEAECHIELLEDIREKGDPNLMFKFLKARYNKLYTANPNAHVDDETGGESRVSMLDVLRDRLSTFLEKDE